MQPQSRSVTVRLAGQLCPALPAGLGTFRGEQPGCLGCPTAAGPWAGCCSLLARERDGVLQREAPGRLCLCPAVCRITDSPWFVLLPRPPYARGVGRGQSSLCVWGRAQLQDPRGQTEPVGPGGSGTRMKQEGTGLWQGQRRKGEVSSPSARLPLLSQPG